jgi:hypothetical protein
LFSINDDGRNATTTMTDAGGAGGRNDDGRWDASGRTLSDRTTTDAGTERRRTLGRIERAQRNARSGRWRTLAGARRKAGEERRRLGRDAGGGRLDCWAQG